MSRPKLVNRRNRTAMCRARMSTRVPEPSGCFSSTFQPLFWTSHAMKAPTASGNESLNRRHRTIAGLELEHATLPGLVFIAHAPIRRHVRAAEAVDGLLWIPDDEQLARHAAGEKLENLRLQWICVLELVDEDPREFRLKMPPDVAVVAD